MPYGVIHTTNVLNAKPMSFLSSEDIENASFVTKGALVAGETQIYTAVKPAAANLTQKAYVVANPAWSYDTSKATNQNEEEFINVKDKPFRTYDLTVGNKITVTNYSLTGTVAKDSYIVLADGSYKGVAVAAKPTMEDCGFVGQITDISELGYFYTVGQFGTNHTNELGTGIDGRVTMVTIEVIKNG